jgi:hypothetical protein
MQHLTRLEHHLLKWNHPWCNRWKPHPQGPRVESKHSSCPVRSCSFGLHLHCSLTATSSCNSSTHWQIPELAPVIWNSLRPLLSMTSLGEDSDREGPLTSWILHPLYSSYLNQSVRCRQQIVIIRCHQLQDPMQDPSMQGPLIVFRIIFSTQQMTYLLRQHGITVTIPRELWIALHVTLAHYLLSSLLLHPCFSTSRTPSLR